jgi:putative aldouronate transport system substrate-binding protein
MTAFMRAHPGSYGIGVRKTLDEVYWAAPAYGALPKIWIDAPDGSLVYGSIQPEMKGILEKFADWYKRGYLRKDFTALTDREICQDIAAEKLGVHIWGNWAGWSYVDAVRALGMNTYMEPYEIPSSSASKPNIFPIPLDNSEYIVVNKNSKLAAAALKCISYNAWVCMEATLQGGLTDAEVDRYLLGGEGRHDLSCLELDDPWGNGPVLVEWAHEIGLNNYQMTRAPMTSEWPAQYEQAAPWFRDNNPEGYGRWIQQYNARSSAWVNLQVINQGRFVPTRMIGSMPEEGMVYGGTEENSMLEELLHEGYTKIIVGEQPISYFDTVVAQWKASGGDVVTRAVNKEYGKK